MKYRGIKMVIPSRTNDHWEELGEVRISPLQYSGKDSIKGEYSIITNEREAYVLCKYIIEANRIDPIKLLNFIGFKVPDDTKNDTNKYEF